MKSDIEKWTIVIVGLWDCRLFTPASVSKGLFDGKTVEVQVPMNLSYPFRFNAEGVVLIPENDRVIIGIKESKDDNLNRAEKLARKTLDSFSQVPIGSFGINFGFIEETPGDLAALFNLSDIQKLSDNNYKIGSTEIKRKLEYERGNLNITHSFAEGVVRIHLNFNHPCQSTKLASESLDNLVIKCRGLALDLLKRVYGLTLEEEQPQ